MTQFSAADIKPHLSLAADDAGQDGLISDYIASAEAAVQAHVRRDLDAEFPAGWPADILQALRFLVAHFYAHREAVTPDPARELPFGVMMMLAPHRDLGA